MIRAHIYGDDLDALEIFEDLRPQLQEAVNEGAEIIRRRAVDLLGRQRRSRSQPTPEGGPPLRITGELQDAIGVREGSPRTKAYVQAVVQISHPNRKKQREIAVKAQALEWGGTDRFGRVHPPYPFMRKAEKDVYERVNSILEDVVMGDRLR
jgi:hypothetical protein